MDQPRRHASLLPYILVSALLNTGLVALWAAQSGESAAPQQPAPIAIHLTPPPPPIPPIEPIPDPVEPPDIELGDPDATTDGDAWVTEDVPEQLQAEQSDVEQAALAPDAEPASEAAESDVSEHEAAEAVPTPTQLDPMIERESEPVVEREQETANTSDSENAEPNDSETQSDTTDMTISAPRSAAMPDFTPALSNLNALMQTLIAQANAVTGQLEEALAQAQDAAQQAAQESQSSHNSAQPNNTSGGPDNPDALVSESESDARSLKQPLEYEPGSPLARKGLKLITVKPQFDAVSRIEGGPLSARPRDTLIRIGFDHRGRATRVTFLESSKRSPVDHAIEIAAYRWKARGAEIDALKVKWDQAVAKAAAERSEPPEPELILIDIWFRFR